MSQLSYLRKQVSDLCKKRDIAINKVMNTKPFIAAQVYERYKKCGKQNCKCKKGELHGPYHWIYQKKKGQKVVSTTISDGKYLEAKELSKRYEKLLALRQEIRESDREINELLNKIESEMEKEVTEYVRRKKSNQTDTRQGKS